MRSMEQETNRDRERRRWHIAQELTRQYLTRADMYAIQLVDGRYVVVKKHFTPGVMYLHLLGQLTVGGYLLDTNSQTRQLVLDADGEAPFDKLKSLAGELVGQGVPSYLETSRRGGHLRLFFPQPVSGQLARGLGLQLQQAHDLQVEIYPKQAALGDGPGSLVRLPFGRHRLTGQRYGFIHPDGSTLGSWRQQVDELAHPQTVPLAFVEAHQYAPVRKREAVPKTFRTRAGQGETVWERIKDSISVYDFVSQYVTLTPSGSGYVGLCPFHDDHHPSFGINAEGNYWNCFAGCGGGSVIDFWMLQEGVDFKTAVADLEAMLLGGKHE